MQPGYRQWEPVGACTESLGSESGEVGGDAEIDLLPAAESDQFTAVTGLAEAQISSPEKRRHTERRLPPVMPRRSAEVLMRAERCDGRLILTEVVRIEKPREVFRRESRADGHLMLRFADDPDGEEAEAETEPGTERIGENGVLPAECCNGVGLRQATDSAGGCDDIGAVMGL